MKTFEISGVQETVYERKDIPNFKEILKKETVCVLGYGPQGRGQSLNLRDNGVKVFVCSRKHIDQAKGIKDPGYENAVADGWVPGETLIEDMPTAVRNATVVQFLLSDAGQKACWPIVKDHLREGAALYFSHGFSIVYRDQTGVIPPKHVDVIMVAPKGSGTTLRRLYVAGSGINCSFAVERDHTGRARERCMALGVGIGCGYMFETTFKQEVFSDLTGERGVLMGAIYGLFRAQYELFRRKGHSPAEAFNETVEEATQSLYPLIGENGMDWMYSNCSATAQRGALDWYKKFEDATRPVFEELYAKVASGEETKRVLEVNSKSDYLASLKKELAEIANEEMWRVGKIVRALRPERTGQGVTIKEGPTAGQRAAKTRKAKAAGKKAAKTRKARAAGRKAAATRKARGK
ncbi:MAG: ketol-acid reductoisomerase [Planctomycetota bacterium]|nr:ketol-acid reductoisomerase [Planctomycetota bacterium]